MADEQLVCPKCGHFNRAGARFCSACGHVFNAAPVAAPPVQAAPVAPAAAVAAPAGQPAPAAKIACPTCGKEVSSDTRFCRHCGHALVAASTIAPKPGAAATVAPAADDKTAPLTLQSAAPDKSTDPPAAAHGRGAPSWLWTLLGLLIGLLLGAGVVLAAPGFVGLERIAPSILDAATETPAPAESPAAQTVAPTATPALPTATPVPPPTETVTEIPTETPVETPTSAPAEQPATPAATAPGEAAAPAGEAPAAETPAPALDETPAEVIPPAATQLPPTSTPLAP